MKNPTHSHLYISLGSEDKPPMYNCFLCSEGGILTPAVLRELGLYDYNIHEKLLDFNKNISRKYPRVIREGDIYNIQNRFIRDDPISYNKLNYVNSRLGLNLTFKDMIDNKIVLNLYDILKSNNLTPNGDKLADEFDQHFVGFLSQDNNFVLGRNVDSTLDVKHHKYNIHGKFNNDKRYYILPCNLDLNDPRPIDVHIGEGPFDILSIKYNTTIPTLDRSLFIAMGGKAYKNIARHLIAHMGLINITLHYYVDADVDDYTLYNVARYLEPYNLDIYLHRNGFPGEKDYGVPKDRIIDTVIELNRRK